MEIDIEQPIPVTVAILTFNSAATLERALDSVADVAEVVVADGGSTDKTREIVRRYGHRLIDQPAYAKGLDGRLVDYGAARNHLRQFATQPWIMQLDSDEYASEALMADLRRVCIPGGPDHYTMQARYELRGRMVECAGSYPMAFPRLVRASACTGWIGKTSERADVNGEPGTLDSFFVIPYPRVSLMLKKWWHYLKVDGLEYSSMDREQVLEKAAYHRSAIRWFLTKLKRSRMERSCAYRLPLYHEALRVGFYVARYVVALRHTLPGPPGRPFVRSKTERE